MITGYRYAIVEGFRGLKRAKFSTSISIFTIFLSLVIIAVFLIFILNVHWIVAQIQSRMELEAFIDNSYIQPQIDQLLLQIHEIEGVEEVRYISKQEAAEIFREQFGEDAFKILEDNPLPASFQIRLKPEYRSSEPTQNIFSEILKLDGIDEIIYRHDLLMILERYMHIFLVVIIVMAGLLALSSMILVSNTIKLIIYSRRKTIEIMKLVGATRSFIRRPFLIEGIVQGCLGGGLAALLFYLLFKIINIEIPNLIFVDTRIYLLLLILGIVLGFSGSVIALRKFIKY